MPEDFAQSRTEPPTQRRREESRQQGQVAFSAELSNGLLLLAGVAALWFGGRKLVGGLVEILRAGLLDLRVTDWGVEQVQLLLLGLMRQSGEVLGLFLALLFVVGLGVGLIQAGVHFSWEPLVPQWERLSPASGWARIFSAAAAVRGLMSLAKVAVVAALAAWLLRGRGAQIAALGQSRVGDVGLVAWDIAIRLALAIAAALVVIGLADYAFQRWRHEQSLYMTRQELKEELKREEGDPLMRARIRRLQREAARKRMMEQVPQATVVITNPTRLAIALRYEQGTMAAPRVIAKGAGFVAERIVALARQHAVPVVERRPLAQALYRAVQVDQDIPAALYYAVAEVLAYVYRLRGIR
jgi:flagellar biosynthetic protein FlhB